VAQKNKSTDNKIEIATFYVGEALCGIDILSIQEINKQTEVTVVPQSPEYVKGVLNLRGRIVTVIDLGEKIGLSPISMSKDNRNVIVDSHDEHIGLLVEKISDVMTAEETKIEAPPANIGGIQGKYFSGVFKTETSLVGILDIGKALQE